MDVDIKTGTIFHKTQKAFEDGNKIIVHRGGTGSGKTYDLVLFLFSIALRFKDLIITIVSESKPHLDIGAIRILSNVCKPLGLWGKSSWNISTSRWTAPTGSIIEFFSADRIDKALGARRDYLYGNEVNSLKKDVWDELARRSENVIADFNPTAQFWMENWLSNYDKTIVIKSNYTDNPFLPETERNRIEMRVSRDENFKRIHFDCEYGVTEGIIFSNWYQIDKIPQELEEKAIYGLDFGYSCFEGNTLITTLRGDIPIKNITKNDFVLTRKGYKKVRNVLNNGVKKVIGKKIGFDVGYTEIFSTFEHHFKTEKGWKQYGKLDLKDRLTLRLSSMAKNIENIQITSKNITSAKNRLAERRNLKDCTLKFINILKEKYQKVMLFITSMGTETTMTSKICKQSQSLNTPNFIECSKILIQNLGKSIGQYMVIAKRTGMKGGKKFLKNWRTLLRFVFNVVKNLRLQIHIKSLVHQNVITNGNTKLNDSMLNLSVNSAGISLEEINISNQNAVQENVHINYLQEIGEKEVEVYDLEIEGVHEYFANGILVHNCDPTALIKTIETEDAFYFDELIYQTGMLNSDIIRRFDSLGLKKNYDEIIADSAEPKSIQEMCNAGYNVKGAVKGPDSIIKGIDTLLSKPIYVTKRSVNLIKELRAYSWALNKDGNPTNKPIDAYNHCFVGETLIETINGSKRIDAIKVGDFVATSNGYKKVINIFNNGCKKILYIKIKFSTFTVELKATPEHKIKTVEGWKKLKDLRAGDRLFTRAKNLMEKPITYTQEKGIILEDAIECMSLYGSSIMGKGQKATIFITLMGMLKIIASKTLNVFMGVNTCQTMQNLSWKMISMLKNYIRGWIMLVCSQINGMVLRLGGNGTQSMQLRLQPIYGQRTIFVKSVEYPTKARVEAASVLINVSQNGEETQDLTMNRGFASNVEKHSFVINTQKENFAVENVVEEISLVSVGKDNVYDIEVDDMHEYFANGILVHNCIDASRYSVMHKINKFEFSIY